MRRLGLADGRLGGEGRRLAVGTTEMPREVSFVRCSSVTGCSRSLTGSTGATKNGLAGT